jgi:hypothetical protein
VSDWVGGTDGYKLPCTCTEMWTDRCYGLSAPSLVPVAAWDPALLTDPVPCSIIKILRDNLDIPVSAKIRLEGYRFDH